MGGTEGIDYDAILSPKGDSKDLAFDSSRPSGPCVKSKTVTKELEFFRRYRLAGLVVKTSVSWAEDPGFESRLRRDFPGSSHTSTT